MMFIEVLLNLLLMFQYFLQFTQNRRFNLLMMSFLVFNYQEVLTSQRQCPDRM